MGLPPVTLGADIPVQSPAATPPFLPGQGDPSQQLNDKTKQLLTLISQAASRKQMANTAVPMAVPPQQDPAAARNIGMNTENPNAWGKQRLMAGIATSIKNAVGKQKQDQLLKAEGDWTYLQSSLNELYQAQQSGDPQAVKAAQAKVDVMMNDPKKLKNMAKALNQDWLNPEKTTVYGEALKNVTAKTQQQDAAKQQARQGIMGIFQKLKQKAQGPQLTPEQIKAMGQEIQAKAPTQTAGVDKDAVKILEEQMKEEAAQKRDDAKAAEKEKQDDIKFQHEKELNEAKEAFTKSQTEAKQAFDERIKKMQEASAEHRQEQRDYTMLKATGMRIDAQMEKMFKPDPAKLDKEVDHSLATFKTQYTQANSALNKLRGIASNKWFGEARFKDELDAAQSNVNNLQKAMNYIEKNRDAIKKGTKDLGEVTDKAEEIMAGGGQESPAAVPGFVPDKK